MKRRPYALWLISGSAGVAVWSGWVRLGELTGFGPVEPLPGISTLTINAAITLPLGVEAFAAVAIGAWTNPATPGRARRFAAASATAALVLGVLGQVASHLLTATGATTAPPAVVMFVSSLPVLVLGAAARLWHLVSAGESEPVSPVSAGESEPVSPVAPESEPVSPVAPESEPVSPVAEPRRTAALTPVRPAGEGGRTASASERVRSHLRERGLTGPLSRERAAEVAAATSASVATVRRVAAALRPESEASGDDAA